MSSTAAASNTTSPTQILSVSGHAYAYRRFGKGSRLPLLCLQHFTGTLDNWDPAVTDPLATDREVILFDNAGIGRSSGEVPTTIAQMARHPMAFLDALRIERCDVLGYSLGGMIALQMVQDRPSILRRLILVGTGHPRGGEDIKCTSRNSGPGEAPPGPKRTRGTTSCRRSSSRRRPRARQRARRSSAGSRNGAAGTILILPPDRRSPARRSRGVPARVEGFKGERFAELKAIRHPTLVVNGVNDEMIPVSNSYRLSENLPNAVLLTYPDAGHGSLFQYPESFTRQSAAFLSSDSDSAAF